MITNNDSTEIIRVDFLHPWFNEEYVFTCNVCGKEKIKTHGSKTTYWPGSRRKYPCCQGRYSPFTVTAINLRKFKTHNDYIAWKIAIAISKPLEDKND